MYVLERSGVSWDVRFYCGHSMSNLLVNFGNLDYAQRFTSKELAHGVKKRIDTEQGIHTYVSHVEDFSQ